MSKAAPRSPASQSALCSFLLSSTYFCLTHNDDVDHTFSCTAEVHSPNASSRKGLVKLFEGQEPLYFLPCAWDSLFLHRHPERSDEHMNTILEAPRTLSKPTSRFEVDLENSII